MKFMQYLASLFVVCGICCSQALSSTIALDFGQSDGLVYTGSFDGTSGFVGFEISGSGALESPSMNIGGGVTLSFTNVSGWNNNGSGDAANIASLGDDHFFNFALGADDPVNFEFSGLNSSDVLKVEFLNRFGGSAEVTFNGGAPVVVQNDAAFTDVSSGGVTGATSYTGSFTGGAGLGNEGNLAAARITITQIPEPASLTLLGLGLAAGFGYRRIR